MQKRKAFVSYRSHNTGRRLDRDHRHPRTPQCRRRNSLSHPCPYAPAPPPATKGRASHHSSPRLPTSVATTAARAASRRAPINAPDGCPALPHWICTNNRRAACGEAPDSDVGLRSPPRYQLQLGHPRAVGEGLLGLLLAGGTALTATRAPSAATAPTAAVLCNAVCAELTPPPSPHGRLTPRAAPLRAAALAFWPATLPPQPPSPPVQTGLPRVAAAAAAGCLPTTHGAAEGGG